MPATDVMLAVGIALQEQRQRVILIRMRPINVIAN